MDAPLFDGRPVRVRDLLDARGWSPQLMSRLIGAGRLRRLLPGVLIDAGQPDTLAVRAAAVGLLVPHDAVLCRLSAAWLHGVPCVLPRYRYSLPSVETLRPLDRSGVRRTGVHGWVGVLAPHHVTTIGGVRVTSPTRTLLDLARWLDRPDGLAYVDAFLRRGLVTKAQLRNGLEELTGFRWVQQARELVALGDGRAESAGESWMRLRWYDARLPELELQHRVVRDGQELYRLDSLVKRSKSPRLAPEYDGMEFHGIEQRDRDRRRRRWLRDNEGIECIVYGRAEVLGHSFAFEERAARRGLEPRLVPWQRRLRTFGSRGWLTTPKPAA